MYCDREVCFLHVIIQHFPLLGYSIAEGKMIRHLICGSSWATEAECRQILLGGVVVTWETVPLQGLRGPEKLKEHIHRSTCPENLKNCL